MMNTILFAFAPSPLYTHCLVDSLNSSVQRRVANNAAGRASLKVLSRRSSFFAVAIFLHLEWPLHGQGFHSGFAEFQGSLLYATHSASGRFEHEKCQVH